MLLILQQEPLLDDYGKEDNLGHLEPDDASQSMNQEPIMLPLPTFVPALEGLRGVAVLLTVLSHIQQDGPLKHNSGRSGVSIFFVLSGFLITGVLIAKQETYQCRRDKISYRHLSRFYLDRAVRLYPAVLVMILLTGFIQAYMLGWTMPSGLYGNAIMALVYLSNFEYWRPHVKSIWKNTWSLATEEQFYIIWSLLLPFLLLQTPERRRNFIVGLIFGSLLLSTMKAACIYSNPDWLFGDYSPLSNFWKMFVGSLLRLSISSSRNIKPYFCWTGLTVLCLSILATVPASPIDLRIVGADPRSLGYQVFMEPIAVICAILIILGSLNGNWLLETKAVRFVGSISYSLYLYQIPILEIRNWPRGMDAVGLSSLAFILAMISTLYIEEPLRAYYKKALHAAL